MPGGVGGAESQDSLLTALDDVADIEVPEGLVAMPTKQRLSQTGKVAYHWTMDASSSDWLDAFEERAAILEFDAALARATADHKAVAQTTHLILATHGLDACWHDAAARWFRSGLPSTWIFGALHLQASPPKADWPIARWPALQEAVADFCSEWAVKARDFGWTERELFGCHNQAPWHRLDGQGLALRLHGSAELESVDQDGAMFRVGRSRQSYRRGQNAPLHPSEQSVIWCP